MTTNKPVDVQTIFDRGLFDPTWYESHYGEVALLKMDPHYHFEMYGFEMGRAPSYKLLNTVLWKEVIAHGEPTDNNILMLANRIAETHSHKVAAGYARYHLPEELQHSALILEANAAVQDGNYGDWLNKFNDYLSYFGTAPIRLKSGKSLLERLTTEELPSILDGSLVSVIMPAWNSQDTIEAAAKSILSQTWRNLELLIVDDASSDQTWSKMQGIAAADPRVKIFKNTVNVGPYVSKNVALGAAKGKWITGHDADDWAHPERIVKQVKYCEEKEINACLAGMARISPKGKFVKFNPISDGVYDGICRTAFISLMIRRDLLKSILGGWDNVRTSGDSEILRRIETLTARSVPFVPFISMLCLDSPEGLTNNATYGRPAKGKENFRAAYKASFLKWHKKMKPKSARLGLSTEDRLFAAPEKIIVAPEKILELIRGYSLQGETLARDIEADVAIITNTRFPGGNASSTLEEVSYFKGIGLNCAVIHCPVERDIGRPISERYAKHFDAWVDFSEINSLKASVLICRNPSVLSSRTFKELSMKISADGAFFVINNSRSRIDGTPVYNISDLHEITEMVQAEEKVICPISPLIRQELEENHSLTGRSLVLSSADWNPTFDLGYYSRAPKQRMSQPFVIGRHGRDGSEKWIEDRTKLIQAYPDSDQYRVFILGGASNAEGILQGMPRNWDVRDFGSMPVDEYLAELDVFVYYPNSSLVEGFGRTIVEAMLAGVPVILPPSFKPIFGDLPIYCEPDKVDEKVNLLSRADSERVRYLSEVQSIVSQRFSNDVLLNRISGFCLPISELGQTKEILLSRESAGFRASISI